MDDVTFSRGPARRPMPRVADPLLQWATGLQTNDRRLYAGWLAEVGRSPSLDDAMQEAGFNQVTIKHGSGNMVTHWAVETANLYVIAEGVQTIAEMQRSADRYGIAFGWRTQQGGRQQSQIRFRALLSELTEIGYTEPLLVTAKGTLTGDVIIALMRQYEVLDAVDAFRQAQGKPPMQPPFYACAIPLGPGADVTRGQGGQTKEITPVVAKIPDVITREYVLDHWIKKPLVPIIEDIMDTTIAWSVATSTQIAAGEEAHNNAPVEEEASMALAPASAAAPRQSAPAAPPQRGPAYTANGASGRRRSADDDLL